VNTVDIKHVDHLKFLKHLKESQSDVRLVADWFKHYGWDAQVCESTEAPTYSEWQDHADDGDIYIHRNGKQYRVEVKHLSANFTNANDWPFGKHFIICAKHAWDNADPKPHLYIYLNKDKTHFAVVKGITRDQWYTQKRRDSRYTNETQSFYFTNPMQVEFKKFGDAKPEEIFFNLYNAHVHN
jgi:hypothetical protein